jgi:hypothetical protein
MSPFIINSTIFIINSFIVYNKLFEGIKSGVEQIGKR